MGGKKNNKKKTAPSGTTNFPTTVIGSQTKSAKEGV